MFWRDILKTSNKQTWGVMQTLYRRPWGRYMNAGLHTPHSTRRRLARYYLWNNVQASNTWNRKYRSGFIITMLAQSVNTLSSLGIGQPGMCSSSWTMMRSWRLQQQCLESSQASQGFWEICRMWPLLSSMIPSQGSGGIYQSCQGKVLDNGNSFLSSVLHGRMLCFGRSGDNLGFNAFQSLKVHPFLSDNMYSYAIQMLLYSSARSLKDHQDNDSH